MINYTEDRHLECALTDEEVQQYGEDLAHRLLDIGALELEKARVNSKIKPIKEEVEELVTKIDTKKEVRSVICDWHYDWDAGKKRLIRTDTYDTLPNMTLNITENEKQQQLEVE